MQIINGVKVSKVMKNQIMMKMTICEDVPYRYKIIGTPGGGCTAYGSATIFLNKLSAWARRYGTEVSIVEDRFTHKAPSKGCFIVEITDPVGFALEKIIEERGRIEREA